MKNLLVLSHVLPFPEFSGQQQRVKNTLKALKHLFRVTFVTVGKQNEVSKIEAQMSDYSDKVICLPSKYNKNNISKLLHRGIGSVKSYRTALKLSNYVIGELEFAPDRISSVLADNKYDCALFEYFHAFKSVEIFRKKNIPCVLDMHNVLWQAYANRQNESFYFSKWWRKKQLQKYTAAEEAAWNQFDGIIAINKEEYEYVKQTVKSDIKVFYAPMGIDLTAWKFDWTFQENPPRIGYYGGLGSRHNQQSALNCYENIMPCVWRNFPDAELWIIGSHPPKNLSKLAEQDSRIVVTGFVDDIKSLLQTMSVVVCPWKGIYGFRSRLIEVMALGIPLVTTFDAVYGMDLQNEQGILLGESDSDLAEKVLKLLSDKKYSEHQSRLARLEIEKRYSFENTYNKLISELDVWLESFN